MTGIELGLTHLGDNLGGDAAGFHEIEGLADALGELGILVAFGAVADEIEGPAMHLMQIGKPALGEGAQQVERRRGLVVGLVHAVWIGFARALVEFDPIDDIAPVARQFDTIQRFRRRRARLRELARHAADLDHRAGSREGQHDGHLQQNLEGVADIVGIEFGEALGAIAALQQEGVPLGHTGQLVFQFARLAGEYQRRLRPEDVLRGGQFRGVGKFRHLQNRHAAPGFRRPIPCHNAPLLLSRGPVARRVA